MPGFFTTPTTLAVRLPLLVGLAVFASSVGTTHLALHVMQRELDHEVERLADVYIDSLSGAALPPLRAGDFAGLQAVLERAMGFQRGVTDLAIVVGDRDGMPLARAGEPQGLPPMALGVTAPAWVMNARGDMAWAQRELLEDNAVVALVAAQIAFPEQAERRRRLLLGLMLADLALAALAALLTVLFARRLMRPFLAVAGALDRAGEGDFAPMPVPARDPEAGRLARAFNLMAERLREREALAARLAGRERAAMLGRLAATLAHEVRNPLAGMLTALDTIRRFGAEAAVRGRALDLVERGLRQIEGVVRSTLASYRQDAEPRPITAADLEDLQLLVQPEARRGAVRLHWRVALPEPFPADAQRLRQLLLNLLLNAVAATPPGGNVWLSVTREGEALCAELRDEAGGLPREAGRRLAPEAAGEAPAAEAMAESVAEGVARGQGIGLPIAAELAAALGAGITLGDSPGGSLIRLVVPPQPEGGA